MREIKFRARHKESGKWQYYSLENLVNGHIPQERYMLGDWCEFTGLKDKNGKEIYEGDIVKLVKLSPVGDHGKLVNKFDENQLFEIKFGDAKFYGCSVCIENESYPNLTINDEYEIIGNIYDNPELLTKP